MSDFAFPEAHCRAAFDRVASNLPAGFTGEDWYPAWLAVTLQGGTFNWRARKALAALLPPADQWPVLAPVCSHMADETSADLFLRTASRLVSVPGRAERMARVGDAMPWRRFVSTEDSRTCAEHLALHGLIRRFDDPFWTGFDAEFWWGCRCTSTTMNARTAQRRGYVLPS